MFSLKSNSDGVFISESKRGTSHILPMSQSTILWFIENLNRHGKGWVITRYEGEFSFKIFWGSNHFGDFVRLSRSGPGAHAQIFIPTGFSQQGINLLRKALITFAKYFPEKEIGGRMLEGKVTNTLEVKQVSLSNLGNREEAISETIKEQGKGKLLLEQSLIEPELRRMPTTSQGQVSVSTKLFQLDLERILDEPSKSEKISAK